METDSQIMSPGKPGMPSTLNAEIMRQRAQQAAAYYQKRIAPANSSTRSDPRQSTNPMNGSFDALRAGVTPVSSDTFSRAKMTEGFHNMRSSYNEKIGSGRQRAERQRVNISRNNTNSPKPKMTVENSLSHASHFYRSNSNSEMDSFENDYSSSTGSNMRRDYGSTSSLDILSTSSDGFFAMIDEFRTEHSDQNRDQRSLAPPKLQELLRGDFKVNGEKNNNKKGLINQERLKRTNGLVVMDKENQELVQKSPKLKTKFKSKDRKVRAKSITGESNTGLFKKLRGAKDSDASNKSNDASLDSDSGKTDERLKQKAFVHYDCQSIGVSLNNVILRNNSSLARRNTSTGASAASANRDSLVIDKDDPDLLADTDDGDDRENSLVSRCQYFRNEIGGEEQRTIGLTLSTAQKRSQVLQSHTHHSSTHGAIVLHRNPVCCGISVLDSSETPAGERIPPLVKFKGNIVEYVDHGALYYRNFFAQQDHQNYFGIDDQLGPVAVSTRREKLDERTNNLGKSDYGQYQYRVIVRTSELTTLRGSILEDCIPSSSRLSSSRGVPMKDVLEYVAPEIVHSCLRLATPGQKTIEQLQKLDEQGISNTYKVGIMYCKGGQSSEEDMYNNEKAGPAFEEFLDCLGTRVRLMGFEGYRAQLDNKTDSTGTHSLYAHFPELNAEIMFHVSTMLPYMPKNKQQLLRKRHIGNDIVTIVFQEPGAVAFTPKTVRSQFQHVFIIVKVHDPNTSHTTYSVAVSRSKDVPPFGPPLPEGATFRKSEEFADFLLTKVINGENAAHRSEKFKAMATRTRQEYLKDLATNYVTTSNLDSGSKLGKFALGSGRKKEKNKGKIIPDNMAEGAIVWQVHVEDIGQAIQVACFLGIAKDTIILIEESSQDVICTIPHKSVLGWATHTDRYTIKSVLGWAAHTDRSLRLYYGLGECVLIKATNPDVDEVHEILNRLRAVTDGCEAKEIQLMRNGLGELGFTIDAFGVITQVEKSGCAWKAGLEKGSHLVEICKIATATMSHNQIIEVLKTSSVVAVLLIPPLDNGQARNYAGFHSCCPPQASVGVPSVSVSEHTRRMDTNNMRAALTLPLHKHTTRLYKHSPTKSSSSNSSGEMSKSVIVMSPAARYAPHTHSDSNLSSGRGSVEGLLSPEQDHQRQRHPTADSQQSSGDERHARYEVRDSSEHPHPGNRHWNSRQGAHALTNPAGATTTTSSRWADSNSSGDSGSHGNYLSSSDSSYSMATSSAFTPIKNSYGDYAALSAPPTGNINFELLKQTQNSKYLLSQVKHGSSDASTNDLSFSSGSSQTTSHGMIHAVYKGYMENGRPHIEETNPSQTKKVDHHVNNSKGRPGLHHKRTHLNVSPVSSNSSSPKSSNRNLSGMSSEESLSHRLRPGVNIKMKAKVTSSFQEELMRLIDPDSMDADIKKQTKKFSPPRYGRLQRTLSDESLHNSKGVIPNKRFDGIGGDVIFTTAVPAKVIPHRQEPLFVDTKISPRAMFDKPAACSSPAVPLVDSTAGLDWSSLVNVATKAIEGTDDSAGRRSLRSSRDSLDRLDDKDPVPHYRQQSPHDKLDESHSWEESITTWSPAASSSPQQKLQDLEKKVQQLQLEVEKERREKLSLRSEVESLQADNIRLQDESQKAADQLRQFTEWFFSTIDRQ